MIRETPLRLAVLVAALAAPALAQSPPQAETRFSTGVMHLREGRVDLALDEFKKAVKEDPKNPYFQKGLGLAYAAKASKERETRRTPPGAPASKEEAEAAHKRNIRAMIYALRNQQMVFSFLGK